MEFKKTSINDLSDSDVIKSLYLSQGLIFVVSAILFTIFFNDVHILMSLLVINNHILLFGISFGIIVVIIDVLLMNVFPESVYDDGGINQRVFKALSVKHIFIAMFVVALSEELLFRGVIQTKFGLIVSSVCFAIIHVRYLKKPLLLISVVILSFFLGYMYLITASLMTTIISHYVIDVSLGLLLKWKQFKSSDRGKFS